MHTSNTSDTTNTTKYNKYLDIDTLVDEALSNPSSLSPKLPDIVEQLAEAIECIEELCPEKYFEFYLDFYKLICGYNFDECLFEYATSLMKNVDGSTGSMFSPDESNEIMKKYGLIPNNQVGKFDIAYIFDMYSSDLWDKTLSDDENINIIARATKGFLLDPDAPQQPGRALRFFTKVAMWHPEKKK